VLDKIKADAMSKANLKKRELELKTARFLKFLQTNLKIILGFATTIIQTIIVIEVAVFVISILSAFGSSPHFYCDNSQKELGSDVYKQYCVLNTGTSSNEGIVQACNSIAVTDSTLDGAEKVKWKTKGTNDLTPFIGKSGYKPECWISLAPQIDDLLSQRGTPYSNGVIDKVYANCTYNAGSAIVWSGSDDSFPITNGPSSMREYMRNHKDKWEEVTGQDLQPGDVCVDNGHIWISMSNCSKDGVVTDNKAIQDVWPGSTSARYEGSWQDFYPMLNNTPPTKSFNSGYAAFRFIGKINENSEFKKLKP
jgi:hypothetical protein